MLWNRGPGVPDVPGPNTCNDDDYSAMAETLLAILLVNYSAKGSNTGPRTLLEPIVPPRLRRALPLACKSLQYDMDPATRQPRISMNQYQTVFGYPDGYTLSQQLDVRRRLAIPFVQNPMEYGGSNQKRGRIRVRLEEEILGTVEESWRTKLYGVGYRTVSSAYLMPRATIPEAPEKNQCRAMLCNNEGTKACTRSLSASAEIGRFINPSAEIYTFKIELLGSKDPKIYRIVDVPAWYTFQYLHFVIQYAFGPWQQCHLHEFYYARNKANRTGTISFDPVETVLKILAEGEEPDALSGMRNLGLFNRAPPPVTPHLWEKQVKLEDVYDEAGPHHRRVLNADGKLTLASPTQDHWEHRISFGGEKMATADRPLFSEAIGYPPAEDAGGITGWEEVKAAFAAQRPTRDQLERRKWAIERMGFENGRKDPLAVGDKEYNPFNEVNVIVMNYEGRWENHLNGYREDLGEKVENNFDDDDDDDEEFAF
ncbi:hypothetical protein D9757_011553 [Collybiopsis confluens]|uniref:Plasmid pRiA4b Orf3-like domain-containing protein n=1 Tax=Collybiopsis confluens TaxID=2823264 RepID=A0A8H5GBC2_9AGAR|nr:hypothetical protein D9757_011553 [Collybiopsis confluens]